MSTSNKIWLGILTFLPFVLFIVFLPLIAAGIISLIITIYYIVLANSNVKNDTAKKIMWTIILIIVSWIGCIVYYFVEILPSDKQVSEVQLND